MIVEDQRHIYGENFDYNSVDNEISTVKILNSSRLIFAT